MFQNLSAFAEGGVLMKQHTSEVSMIVKAMSLKLLLDLTVFLLCSVNLFWHITAKGVRENKFVKNDYGEREMTTHY